MNKYTYWKVIQGNYGGGYGFEDVDFHETDSQGFAKDKCDCSEKKCRTALQHNLREYRASGSGTYRVVKRREFNFETA